VRWCPEVRRFKPSTVSGGTSVVCGFDQTCVSAGLLEDSPAEWLRRPTVPPESPTLGLTHLQCEALLTATRESANRNGFAWWLLWPSGLLGLRMFETCAAEIDDLGEDQATGFSVVSAREARWSSCRCHRRLAARSTALDRPHRVAVAAHHPWRAEGLARRHPQAAPPRGRSTSAAARMHPHLLPRTSSRPCSTPASTGARSRSPPACHPRTTMRDDRARRTSTDTPTPQSPPTWPPGHHRPVLPR
jgi:hypothetical protein